MIPVPFWKPQGNPNILLWVPFTDATAKDISIYNRTPTTTITPGAGSLINGFLRADINSASPTNFDVNVSYLIPPLPWAVGSQTIPSTVPLTFEGFVKWNASANNSAPFSIFRFNTRPTAGSPDRRWISGFANIGKIELVEAGGGTVAGPTGTGVLAPAGTLYHWAWVIPADGVGNTQRIYINGVQVLTRVENRTSGYSLAADGEFVIGWQINTNGGPPSQTSVDLGETRVSAANLYPNGTSFTPPTPGNLPPVP